MQRRGAEAILKLAQKHHLHVTVACLDPLAYCSIYPEDTVATATVSNGAGGTIISGGGVSVGGKGREKAIVPSLSHTTNSKKGRGGISSGVGGVSGGTVGGLFNRALKMMTVDQAHSDGQVTVAVAGGGGADGGSGGKKPLRGKRGKAGVGGIKT
jgi:hypothetical protein